MKTVPLNGEKAAGRLALVDDTDYDLVMTYKWHVAEDMRDGRICNGPYARTNIGGRHRRTMTMHVMIMGFKGIDHKDGNGLNNQRENLRPATASQNMRNRRKRWRGTSRYVGVTLNSRTGRWAARIGHGRKVHNLGTFTSEEEAARAYDAAARELFGEYARPNFPEGQAAA